MQGKIVNFLTLLSVTKIMEHRSIFQELLNWGGDNNFGKCYGSTTYSSITNQSLDSVL